jgi:hypothetical protein
MAVLVLSSVLVATRAGCMAVLVLSSVLVATRAGCMAVLVLSSVLVATRAGCMTVLVPHPHHHGIILLTTKEHVFTFAVNLCFLTRLDTW